MKTAIYEHSTKSKALREMKYQLCSTKITIVSCNYFFDEMDKQHKVVIHYYE